MLFCKWVALLFHMFHIWNILKGSRGLGNCMAIHFVIWSSTYDHTHGKCHFVVMCVVLPFCRSSVSTKIFKHTFERSHILENYLIRPLQVKQVRNLIPMKCHILFHRSPVLTNVCKWTLERNHIHVPRPFHGNHIRTTICKNSDEKPCLWNVWQALYILVNLENA